MFYCLFIYYFSYLFSLDLFIYYLSQNTPIKYIFIFNSLSRFGDHIMNIKISNTYDFFF